MFMMNMRTRALALEIKVALHMEPESRDVTLVRVWFGGVLAAPFFILYIWGSNHNLYYCILRTLLFSLDSETTDGIYYSFTGE